MPGEDKYITRWTNWVLQEAETEDGPSFLVHRDTWESEHDERRGYSSSFLFGQTQELPGDAFQCSSNMDFQMLAGHYLFVSESQCGGATTISLLVSCHKKTLLTGCANPSRRFGYGVVRSCADVWRQKDHILADESSNATNLAHTVLES